MTYKKDVCVRCGCGVVALEDEVRPLCVDCVNVLKMQERRQADLKEKKIQRHCNYCGQSFEGIEGDLERLCPECRED